MSETGRREKDLTLVEDFEYVRAVTADGNSVRVPKSMFGGNLEIANENVLGGIKASEKSETDTQEVKIDPVTGKLFVPKGEGTPPDDEDITLAEIDGEERLQFKDKLYNASSYSGLGRKYLRKNMVDDVNVLTQAFFNNEDGTAKSNTRYIIQYDYDLNGATITIPEGCVLDFQGGSFSNGTIISDDVIIESPLVKIFDNIKFEGRIITIRRFEVDWFVDEFEPLSYNENPTTDATIQLQELFNCGAENIHFNNNKSYHVTDTLIINHHVNITGLPYREREFGAPRTPDANKYPSVFTTKPITIIKYIQNHETSDVYRPVNIGGFNLLCCYDYSTNYVKSELPLLHILCEGNTGDKYANTWGLNIDVNITGILRNVEGNPQDVYPNMDGILLEANGTGSNYITYINIDGYIQGVLCAIRTKTTGSAWITSLVDNTDKNWVVQCCNSYANPTIINGHNQNNYNRFSGLSPDAIFVVGNNITLNGVLWDIPIARTAVKCSNFTNNCPTFMGIVDVSAGTKGYNNDYYQGPVTEIPYQGKTNNILEGLNKNNYSALSNKLYEDLTNNMVSRNSLVKSYDIELFNSSNPSEYTSVKNTLIDELNIFNSDYLGNFIKKSAKENLIGYNNHFSQIYGTYTSIRYTIILNDVSLIDESAYLLTHTGDFEKVKVTREIRDSEDVLISSSVLKEWSPVDYYRNVHYLKIGSIKGGNTYNNFNSGYSKIIIEYINASSSPYLYPPIGLFNSSYHSFGVSGGNVVGRANLQDLIHATPGTSNMNIHYIYNQYYGCNTLITTEYTRIFRVKTRYNSETVFGFSFRSQDFLNYIEIKKKTATARIGDIKINVKVDIYNIDSFIYYDVYVKSLSSVYIEFGKLFSSYGLEFLKDNNEELNDKEAESSTEFDSYINNNKITESGTSELKTVRIKVSRDSFSGIFAGGYRLNRTVGAINLSTGTGSNDNKPTKLVLERLATLFHNTQTNFSAIAYYEQSSYSNYIEITFSNNTHGNFSIIPIQGVVSNTEYITESKYDESIHTNYVSATVMNKQISDSTDNRPTYSSVTVGTVFFDTSKNKPYWATSQGWVDANGIIE